MDVWQRESQIGVVCFDRQRDDVYIAQPTDKKLQGAMQIRNSRFTASELERSMGAVMFLASVGLVYGEAADGRGEVSFDAGAEAEAAVAVDLQSLVESDYGDAAENALAAATAKAQGRAKKKRTMKRLS